MQVSPAPQVSGAIQQHHSTFVTNAGSESEHPEIAFAPQAGIAKSDHIQSCRRRNNDRLWKLLPRAQIFLFSGQVGVKTARQLRRWVGHGVGYARSLPPK